MDEPRNATRTFEYKRWPRWLIFLAIVSFFLFLMLAWMSPNNKSKQGIAPFIGMMALVGTPFLWKSISYVSQSYDIIELSDQGVTWRRGQQIIAFIAYSDVKAVEINPLIRGAKGGWSWVYILTYVIHSTSGKNIRFDTSILNDTELLEELNARIPDFKSKTKNPYWPWKNNWR